ncbi:MAG: hypothetical protein JNL05_11965 [Flavobacteriales bacterium]|nr:hypothetical protein [Flavobacteriales bacterium]
MITTRPLGPADLPAIQQLLSPPGLAALPAIRWHLHTPYATVLGVQAGPQPQLVACALHLGGTARITQLTAAPAEAQLAAVVHHLHQQGATHVEAQVRTAHTAPWRALGFRPVHTLVRHAAGLHRDAQRDEVVLLEPAHTLALLHLDRRATGQDRRALLLEHRFAAHAYVEAGQLRGGLLPLLGHGLVLADAPHVGLELQRWLLPHQPHVIVPEGNTAAATHLRERGYRPHEAGTLLALGNAPTLQPELLFAWPWDALRW